MEEYLDKKIVYNSITRLLTIINKSEINTMNTLTSVSIPKEDFYVRQLNGIGYGDCIITIINENSIDSTIQEFITYYGKFYDLTQNTLIDEETTFTLDKFNVTKRYINIDLPYVNSIAFYHFEYNTNEYILK